MRRRPFFVSLLVSLRVSLLLSLLVSLFLVVSIGVVILADGDMASEPLRIGIVTDIHAHDLDSPAEGKVMTGYAERLFAFVTAMNAWPADLVIELGDFVNGWAVLGVDPGDPYRIPQILEAAEAIYARFDGPRYHVLGNHDVFNLSKEEYLERVNITSTYYSFAARGYLFVVLDAQYDEEGDDHAHIYVGVRGFIPQPQLAWLAEILAATDKPTIVCIHQRLDVDFDLFAGGPEILNNKEVQAVLRDSGVVIAVFQGHEHANAYSLIDGIHYITFAPLVEMLIDGEGTPPSWAQVTLDPVARTITIKGEGIQQDRELRYWP